MFIISFHILVFSKFGCLYYGVLRTFYSQQRFEVNESVIVIKIGEITIVEGKGSEYEIRVKRNSSALFIGSY